MSGDIDSGGLTPAELTMAGFSTRLYRLMLAKGWTQAELARQSGVSRDGVSGYIRGNHMPTHEKAAALAEALGVEVDELLPNVTIDAIKDDPTSISFKASTSDPTRGWLRLSRLVTLDAASQVIAILNADGKKAAGGRAK